MTTLTAFIILVIAYIIACIFEDEVNNIEDEKKRNSLKSFGNSIGRLIFMLFK